MLDEHREQLIEKYFVDELSDEERREFEQYYSESTDFKSDVDSQRALIHGLEILSIKNDLKERFKDFNDSEENNDQKVVPLWRKKYFMSIAASVLLLVFFSAYAIVKYKPFSDPKPTDPKENGESSDSIKTPEKTLLNIYDYNYQRIRVDGGSGNQVIGGFGTNFNIPAGSFGTLSGDVIADTVIIDMAEVLNPDEIQRIIDSSTFNADIPVRMVYFNPYHQGKEVLINSLSPPSFDIEHAQIENLKVYYGGKDLNDLDWTSPKSKNPNLIKTPTKIMEDYKRYVMSLDFLDSIKVLYSFNGKVYRHENPRVTKMELSAELINETRSFVSNYAQSEKFNYNVSTAEKMWDLYFQQRNIVSKYGAGVPDHFKNTGIEIQEYLIYEPGWYVVVRRP